MSVQNVLWTAGLDSTCRVVQLASEEGHLIQPYYIFDARRRSSEIELSRIRTMTGMIRSNPATRSTLLDIKIVNLSDITHYDDIRDALRNVRKKYELGRQYGWLACFARQEGIVPQVSLEKGEYGATYVIDRNCKIVEEGSVLRIIPSESTPEGRLLFENLAFPARIWNLTKKEEVEEIIRLGYKDVFEQTWFCHRPVLGKPCGRCNPCRSCISEGLGYRIPLSGRILYLLVAPFRTILNLPK